jgi:bacillithiol synthase
MFINFSDIPGHHNLFLDYLYEFENVTSFYKRDFRQRENYLKLFKELSENNYFREELGCIVSKQYAGLEPSEATLNNISLLQQKQTIAVVTGQQLGILGGPLYTFNKILTAVKLAERLSERYDEFNFVPVFWLEGDDHDFEEVSSIKVIDQNNSLVEIKYSDEQFNVEKRGSIGSIKFNNGLNLFFDELRNNLMPTEFTEPLLDKLTSIYSEGSGFKEAFTKLLFWLFDKYGLVIFDPQDNEVKNLLKPVFIHELENFHEHTEFSVNRSAELEEVYHAQVKVRPVNLFYNFEGGRYLIEPAESGFRLKGKRKKFSLEELKTLIETEPQHFSPNVLLRPICQDYLLPTAFYIAGPSEVSYFAQVNPFYDFFNVTPPFIYPRASATLIEKNVQAIINKYGINYKDIFIDLEHLKSKIVNDLTNNSIDDIFSKANNEIELALDNLKEKLFEIDKTMSDAAAKYKQKIAGYMSELKSKSSDAQKKKYESTVRQIEKAASILYPEGSLQEREINFVYFANKYGIEFIDMLYNELEVSKFEHQLIPVSGDSIK